MMIQFRDLVSVAHGPLNHTRQMLRTIAPMHISNTRRQIQNPTLRDGPLDQIRHIVLLVPNSPQSPRDPQCLSQKLGNTIVNQFPHLLIRQTGNGRILRGRTLFASSGKDLRYGSMTGGGGGGREFEDGRTS